MLQNKCVHYWPEECQGKEYGKTKVRNLSESSTADYTLREFLVSREGSSEEERKVYHYHFQVSDCHSMVTLFPENLCDARCISKNIHILLWGVVGCSIHL
jgi:hypothetical protein